MKRIIAFLFLSLLGFGVLYGAKQNTSVNDGLEKVVYVCGQRYETKEEDIEVIPSGSDFYIVVPADKANEVHKELDDIKGYVLYFNKDKDNDEFLSSIMEYQMTPSMQGETKVILGYTPNYFDYRYVNGKKVNVQVAFTEESIIVGYPLILTGF